MVSGPPHRGVECGHDPGHQRSNLDVEYLDRLASAPPASFLVGGHSRFRLHVPFMGGNDLSAAGNVDHHFSNSAARQPSRHRSSLSASIKVTHCRVLSTQYSVNSTRRLQMTIVLPALAALFAAFCAWLSATAKKWKPAT